jgi:rhodanese-related sulfurtransferase
MTKKLKSVDATAAAKLMEQGALMVDVREDHEYARLRVPGSQNIALSRFGMTELELEAGQAVVFFCASGNRTTVNATRLAEKAGAADAYVLQGGISAWAGAGLPVESGGSRQDSGPGFFARMFSR